MEHLIQVVVALEVGHLIQVTVALEVGHLAQVVVEDVELVFHIQVAGTMEEGVKGALNSEVGARVEVL